MIQQVYEAVLAILNKNNYGYLTPTDFNLYAQQAQLDLFEDVFYQYNNASVSSSSVQYLYCEGIWQKPCVINSICHISVEFL
jgi:hypothetical protein